MIEDITKYDSGKKFDLIICTWALSHMDEPAELVKKYFDYLKKGGHMIFIFQGELKKHRLVGRVFGWIEGLFNAELVSESEMKKFPKAIELNKNYFDGYVRLFIFKK
ncbi:MAG: methyltransferase domain-containing protein [Nitrospirota bacterium]